MERISYSPETLFHVLTHFETADEALRDSLRRAGFTDEAIDGQLRMPGSKFLRTFALSPQEAVARLQRDFPESFTALHPGTDGRVRLSFRYDAPVGTSGLAADAELTPAERAAVRNILRNGCPVRTVRTSRTISTGACQLILERTGEARVCPAHALSRGTRPSPSPAGPSPRSFLGDASPHRIQLNPAATGGGMRTGSEPVFQTMRDRCRAS